MEGKWAILNNDMKVIDIFEGNIFYYDISIYERYGGEVKITEQTGTPEIGQYWKPLDSKFE